MDLYKFRFRVLFIICLLLFSFEETKAQANKLPPFRIKQTNGKIFKAENIPYEKPIVIIYFSPDCDDCLKFMDELFKKINAFNGASIVMITYSKIEELAKFAKKYEIGEYKNIFAGTEGSTQFIRNYYKIMEIPFVAIYDKNGNIQSSFSENILINSMIASLKKLE